MKLYWNFYVLKKISPTEIKIPIQLLLMPKRKLSQAENN